MAVASSVVVVLPSVPGDRHHRPRATGTRLLPLVGQVDLAAHRHARGARRREERVVLGHAGAGHDEVDTGHERAPARRRRARRGGRPRGAARRARRHRGRAVVGDDHVPRRDATSARAVASPATASPYTRARPAISAGPRRSASRRSREPSATATQMPEITQKRMMTVVSGQPISSKWWWIGDILKMRRLRPLRRYVPICRATRPISITCRPPMIGSRSCVFVVTAEQRQRGADAERADVAHEDARRRGVPPEEPGAGPGEGHGQDGEVERVDDLVDGRVAEAPEGDDGEGEEAEERRAGGEAVEPVGHVHGVGGGEDDERGPDHPEPQRPAPTRGSPSG